VEVSVKQRLNVGLARGPVVQRASLAASLVFLLLFCVGCPNAFLSYYDPTTYKNLTDLKPEVVAFYQSFTGDTVDQKQIAAINLQFDRVYEYENGKGQNNVETTKQVDIVRTMFRRHVQDRLANGKWTAADKDNKAANISEAFDTAISTERLKNPEPTGGKP
jgi:hypothetical protein